MTAWKIKLHAKPLDSTLNGEEVRAQLRDYAEQIGEAVYADIADEPELTVDIIDQTTDRSVVQVALNGYRGVIVEAERSPLQRAAASLGLDVTAKE